MQASIFLTARKIRLEVYLRLLFTYGSITIPRRIIRNMFVIETSSSK